MVDAPMDPMDPDALLMVAFQNGDIGAFEQLLGKYHRSIVNFIYRIVNNSAEAEELAQDVFLRIYKYRENYEPRARFAAWIFRIAVNVGLKAAERKRHSPVESGESGSRNKTEHLAWDPSAQGADAETRLLSSEVGKAVRGAIRSLPKNEKIAIILRRYEGLSYRESLWMENRKSLIDKKAELDKRNIDLFDILSLETIDESSAVKAFDRASAARHEVERTLFLMRVRIKNLLTPEQQQKLEEIADQARNAAKPKPSR